MKHGMVVLGREGAGEEHEGGESKTDRRRFPVNVSFEPVRKCEEQKSRGGELTKDVGTVLQGS
jgi:hypothetical protein